MRVFLLASLLLLGCEAEEEAKPDLYNSLIKDGYEERNAAAAVYCSHLIRARVVCEEGETIKDCIARTNQNKLWVACYFYGLDVVE